MTSAASVSENTFFGNTVYCAFSFSSSVSPKSFTDLQHKPLLVDLTVEEGQRLKVIYGSSVGFHVIDVDSGNPYDIYIPSHVSDDRPSGGSSPLLTLILRDFK